MFDWGVLYFGCGVIILGWGLLNICCGWGLLNLGWLFGLNRFMMLFFFFIGVGLLLNRLSLFRFEFVDLFEVVFFVEFF